MGTMHHQLSQHLCSPLSPHHHTPSNTITPITATNAALAPRHIPIDPPPASLPRLSATITPSPPSHHNCFPVTLSPSTPPSPITISLSTITMNHCPITIHSPPSPPLPHHHTLTATTTTAPSPYTHRHHHHCPITIRSPPSPPLPHHQPWHHCLITIASRHHHPIMSSLCSLYPSFTSAHRCTHLGQREPPPSAFQMSTPPQPQSTPSPEPQHNDKDANFQHKDQRPCWSDEATTSLGPHPNEPS
ncbi:hypothetical protein PAL_GLEAN10009143 [Pteropus alecto]|uniref:Uncharacterized protein n=1 Tax=Pteropus alecto TaxID=9402 RepID=L5KVP6_PTEAL|nr:hypothetical protein PAL_GLEAN10009143 [Pteropus alecto]